jgi:hypothetical protein
LIAFGFSLEHLRPVKARLWVLVGTTIHGHPILTGGHAIARHLLVVHVGVVAVRLRTTHDRARDGPPIRLIAIVKSADAVGARELILVVGHVAHTVVNGDHAEGVDHAVVGHVVKPVKLVEVALVAHSSVLLLLILLDMSLRVRQVTNTSGVTTADGTLLEVAFQDIATREGVTAQNAHVRAITGVSEEMALKMLRVEVSLGTVRTGELPVSIFDRNNGTLRVTGAGLGRGRAARSTGQDAPAALRADNVSWSIFLLENSGDGGHHRQHVVAPRLLVAIVNVLLQNASGRHRPKDRRAAVSSRGRRDWLRVRRGSGGLGHHTSRGAVSLVRRRVSIDGPTARSLRSLLLVRRNIMCRVGRVWCSWSTRGVGVATIHRLLLLLRWLLLLHGGCGRERVLREGRSCLQVVGGDGGWRWISLTR